MCRPPASRGRSTTCLDVRGDLFFRYNGNTRGARSSRNSAITTASREPNRTTPDLSTERFQPRRAGLECRHEDARRLYRRRLSGDACSTGNVFATPSVERRLWILCPDRFPESRVRREARVRGVFDIYRDVQSGLWDRGLTSSSTRTTHRPWCWSSSSTRSPAKSAIVNNTHRRIALQGLRD